MATALTATIELTGYGTYSNPLDMTTPKDQFTFGVGNAFASLKLSISNGTGSGQCDLWFHDQRTVADASNDNLDLAGSLTNPITGAALTFVKIKVLLVQIVTPAASKVLKVGPQNVSNAWQGPYGGTGATVYDSVRNQMFKADLIDSLGTVTAGTGDILGIRNDSGTSITYNILIMGTSA